MLEAHLRIDNACWSPSGDATPESTASGNPARLAGRFADIRLDGDRIVAVRDLLGLNKLYLGFHADRGIIAANYLDDLVRAGIPFGETYAVPAGCTVTLAPERRCGSVHRFASLPERAGSGDAGPKFIMEIDDRIDQGMRALAVAHATTPVAICLSGGADSSLVAAYTRQHFPQAVAYTYGLRDNQLSADAAAAQQVARHLGLPIRLVQAEHHDLLDALPRAIIHGQDWRDFNVHAAVVNELLAKAITADHPAGALVFTGDLMNEFLADYSPVTYAGSRYYELPRLPTDRLRSNLARGVQTGDREVGVFARHGLTVIQPYAWAAAELLALPNSVSKPHLMTELAHGRLPTSTLHRPKVRAQIGDASADTGVLPQLLRAGIDQDHLEYVFRTTLGIPTSADLHRVIRGGVHRPVPLTPAKGTP